MKWNFKTLTPEDDYQGIRDGDIELFDKQRYQSVVREAIQNSLDAPLDNNKPVNVDFNFFKLNKTDHPELSEIESHLKECLNWKKANDDDKELIKKMIDSIESTEYSCLEISDYNTQEMKKNETFDSFARSRNVSTKLSSISAGSKGMGKAAYFSLSYLRTILVSTISEENNEFLFQGISRLSTHKKNNELLNYKGYFRTGSEPISDKTNVPTQFSRDLAGTSIFIIGIWDDQNKKDLMIEELLNNFWLAILEKELVVNIAGDEFNHENIYAEIKKRWDNLYESGHYNLHPNPRPYIECYLGVDNTSREYPRNLDLLGSVKFTIAKNKLYPGRMAHFRKSKMLIYKESYRLYKGYCGVFICDDKEGNTILKRLENATHTEWKSGNWKDPKGKEALNQLNEFLDECVKDFVGEQLGDEISIEEFDKLISLSGTDTGEGKGLTGKNKKKEKPKPREYPEREQDYTPKTFHWLRNQATLDEEGFKYLITMNSKIPDNQIEFEVLIGSDSKQITADNRPNIVYSSIGEYEDNILRLKLDEGINRVELKLDDPVKNAIRLKEIKR